jgi:hypothetical protein
MNVQGLERRPRLAVSKAERFHPLEEACEPDAGFQARQRRSEAEMNPVAESEMWIRDACNIEARRLGELLWISIGRSQHDKDQFVGY